MRSNYPLSQGHHHSNASPKLCASSSQLCSYGDTHMDDDADNKYSKGRQRQRRSLVLQCSTAATAVCIIGSMLLLLLGKVLTMTPSSSNSGGSESKSSLSSSTDDAFLYEVILSHVKRASTSGGETAETVREQLQQLFEGQSPQLNQMLDRAFEESAVANGRYADKYIHLLRDIVTDPDCLEGEIDLASAQTDDDTDRLVERGRAILSKCKLLVVRNVFDEDVLTDLEQQRLYPYLRGLESGRVSKVGQTSNGENHFWAQRESKRYEILLPSQAVFPQMLLQPQLVEILRSGSILGSDLTLHSAGLNFAEPQSVGQSWHWDENFLWGTNEGLMETGIAGHDMGGAFAVTALVPLLDVTRAHGPTEFCMGSSALQGLPLFGAEPDEDLLDESGPLYPLLYDKSLLQDEILRKYLSHGAGGASAYGSNAMAGNGCHPDFWRSPTLNRGDVLLFDYQMRHRGGWNLSPDTRTVMFFTYSRYWFKDVNFRSDIPDREDDEDWAYYYPLDKYDDDEENEDARFLYHQMVRWARLAQPNSWDNCDLVDAEQQEACRRGNYDQDDYDLRHFTGFAASSRFDDPEEDVSGDAQSFVVSNKDIGGGSRLEGDEEGVPQLYLNGQPLGPLPAGESLAVEGKLGDYLELRSSALSEPQTWNIYYHGQVVFTQDMQEGKV